MSTERPLTRDERIVAVENASFKWAYHVLVYGLLLDCLYRDKVLNQNIGDLLALGCVSVAVSSVYLFKHKAAVRAPAWKVLVIVVVFFAVYQICTFAFHVLGWLLKQ